jgi:uncharacterized OB-fold protein
MPEPAPVQSPLFTTEQGKRPALRGRRCTACGYVFFPPHDFGCDACGALPDRVEPMAIEGAGVLRSVVVVHRHGGGSIEVPFTVGEIALDAGPMVRAVLMGPGPFAIGDRVSSALFGVVAKTAPSDDRGLWSRTVNTDGASGAEGQTKWEVRFLSSVGGPPLDGDHSSARGPHARESEKAAR